MPRIIRPLFLIILPCVIFFLPEPGFSESIEDGILMREDSPIILKDGSVIECNSFVWLVATSDFIQCSKGKRCDEIQIDEVDIEKTFGPEIAKEYAAAEPELKKVYEEKKEERQEDIDSGEDDSTPEPEEKEIKPSKGKKKAPPKKSAKKEPKKTSTSDGTSKVKKDTSKKDITKEKKTGSKK